jgi:hypothetical protein
MVVRQRRSRPGSSSHPASQSTARASTGRTGQRAPSSSSRPSDGAHAKAAVVRTMLCCGACAQPCSRFRRCCSYTAACSLTPARLARAGRSRPMGWGAASPSAGCAPTEAVRRATPSARRSRAARGPAAFRIPTVRATAPCARRDAHASRRTRPTARRAPARDPTRARLATAESTMPVRTAGSSAASSRVRVLRFLLRETHLRIAATSRHVARSVRTSSRLRRRSRPAGWGSPIRRRASSPLRCAASRPAPKERTSLPRHRT